MNWYFAVNHFFVDNFGLHIRKKKDKGKDGKRPISHEVKPKDGDAPPQEEVKEATVKESDLILMQR